MRENRRLIIYVCAILTTKSATVFSINNKVIFVFEVKQQTYLCINGLTDPDNTDDVSIKFFTSLNPWGGLPPHKLDLKIDSIFFYS